MPFGFFVINVCNHGENYETPCIYIDVVEKTEKENPNVIAERRLGISAYN